jgi:glyoxylase-like metal-dependent hydrolase (beta-lactamase superfamily II)
MSKLPQAVFDANERPLPPIFFFPPNRDTLGATAYLIVENTGNILIDCPAWNQANQDFLRDKGPVQALVITHRGAIAHVNDIQQALSCQVLIQEQEAYLLPEVPVTTFQQEFILSAASRVIWTPGHSPGSACFYHQQGILFTGRHLLPDPQGQLRPLQTAKTFHWPRQLRSVQLLIDRLTPETLQWICPGANIGFLRGRHVVDQAYQRLTALDLRIT